MGPTAKFGKVSNLSYLCPTSHRSSREHGETVCNKSLQTSVSPCLLHSVLEWLISIPLKTPSYSYTLEEAFEEKEVQVLAELDHPGIVKMEKAELYGDKLYMVMELCVHTLATEFDTALRRGKYFKERVIKKYMKQLLEATQYLHNSGYIHRDIKPENILGKLWTGFKVCVVTHDGTLKLADFGTAKSISDRPPYTSYVSTRWYRSPELMLGLQKYTENSDVFSLGLVFAEFYTLNPMF